MNKIWWYLILGGLLLYILKRPLEAMYQKRVSGLEAVADASTMNGYTTYNTQLWFEPVWQPFLQFFKAGAYNPGSKSSAPQTVDYSVQG
jgi:hypothetical protein